MADPVSELMRLADAYRRAWHGEGDFARAALESYTRQLAGQAEPAAFMYPSDLEQFQRREMHADAFSVSVTNVDTRERTVPLYTRPAIAQAPVLQCPKCGVDRAKAACPRGYSAALTGDCPMVGTAQQVGAPSGAGKEQT